MVSCSAQSMGLDLIDWKGYIQTWHYDDEPAKISVVRKQVSHGPGFSREHEIVELHNSTGQRRDPSSRERSHSNRPANTERRDIVLADKGMLGSQGCCLCPTDSCRSP